MDKNGMKKVRQSYDLEIPLVNAAGLVHLACDAVVTFD